MRPLLVKPAFCIRGKIYLSGDKSIAHRSIILSSISPGKTVIENFPVSKDCLQTVKVFKRLGIKIAQEDSKLKTKITVLGKGLYGLKKPRGDIFAGDSGTTLRLILGVLAGQNFKVRLTAGKSLAQRPMLRVTKPLRMMGAIIDAKHETRNTKHEEYPPITIRGGKLKPITYKMPVASAQVKSAILLAGLYAEGRTQAIESAKTRDHTERMLKLFKADIKLKQNKIVIKGNQELVSPGRINIPGDISSAAFFLVSAAIIPGSKILIKNVSLNPWRMGLIKVLKRMGAKIRVTSYQLPVTGYEPAGDILIRSSKLKGTTVGKEEIPSLIDELPILMVAASLAKGKTVLEGVGELRVKETDRIESMAENLMEMGAYIQIERAQGTENIIIEGVKNLKGNRVRSFGDHRTAMSMIVAGLKAEGKTLIDDITCISKSFPQFLALLEPLIK